MPLYDLLPPLETWVVLPLLVLAGLAISFVLRAPQLTRLAEGWRGLREDPTAPGSISPASALALSMAATAGAGALTGTATAISLGGPGAVAWLWLFGILVAPLRFAEVLLARTSPPGKASVDGPAGSLGGRIAADPRKQIHPLGTALVILVPVAAVAVVGGLHGVALAETADLVLPGSSLYFAIAAAAAGVALWELPQARAAIGWVGLAGFVALVVALVIGASYDMGRAFTLFPRALDDAFSGSAEVGAFTGALVAEITRAALRHVMPTLVSSIGADGTLHGLARATSARTQAAAAVLATLGHVVVVTLVGMAIVGSGAFSRRVDTERSLSEVQWVDTDYETVSQRIERERRWTGYIRVVEGEMQGDPRPVGIERSMVVEPRFAEPDGTPADFAVHITEGRIGRLLELDEDGALDMAPPGEADRLLVTGSMLPRGAALLLAAVRRAGGDLAGELLLAAMVLLSALLVTAWGSAARVMLAADLGEGPGRVGVLLAALGLVLGASGIAPFLTPVAGIVGGLLAVAGILAILAKLRELSVLVGAPRAAAPVATPAAKPKKSAKRR